MTQVHQLGSIQGIQAVNLRSVTERVDRGRSSSRSAPPLSRRGIRCRRATAHPSIAVKGASRLLRAEMLHG